MATQIKLRRDTATNWASNDPTPALGEPCFETDTGILKIGDGVTAYSSLTASIGATNLTYNALSSRVESDTGTDATLWKIQYGTFGGYWGLVQGDTVEPVKAIPTGGTAGQVIAKIDGDDYNTQWVTVVPEFIANTAADIQAQIDLAEAAGGGVVSCAAGGTITTGLVIDSDNVHLRGNGVTLTASGAIDLITLLNVKNCSVDGFRLDGDWQSGRGVVLEGALYCKVGTYQGINGDRFSNWMFDLRADGSATQNTAGCEFGNLSVDNVTRFMHFQGNSTNQHVANNNFHGGLHAVSAATSDTIMFDFTENADNNAFHGVVRIQLQRAGDIGVRYNTDATMREVYENHFWGGLLIDASNSPTVIDAYNTQHATPVGDTYILIRYENGSVSTTGDSTLQVNYLGSGTGKVAFPTEAQLALVDTVPNLFAPDEYIVDYDYPNLAGEDTAEGSMTPYDDQTSADIIITNGTTVSQVVVPENRLIRSSYNPATFWKLEDSIVHGAIGTASQDSGIEIIERVKCDRIEIPDPAVDIRRAISIHRGRVSHCDITGRIDGLVVTGNLHPASGSGPGGTENTLIEYNYVWSDGLYRDQHSDGFQMWQGGDVTLRRNWIDGWWNAAALIESSVEVVSNILIEENYLANTDTGNGGTSNFYTLYVFSYNTNTLDRPTYVTIRNNWFGPCTRDDVVISTQSTISGETYTGDHPNDRAIFVRTEAERDAAVVEQTGNEVAVFAAREALGINSTATDARGWIVWYGNYWDEATSGNTGEIVPPGGWWNGTSFETYTGFQSQFLPVTAIPTGGTADQVLAKIDGTDYNTEWVDKTGSGVTFSPADYGADPTGVTESSTEVQACIDACQAANGILDLRGTFLIDTGLVIDGATDTVWVVGGPLNRGAVPHSSAWAAALVADTGFTGTLLTIDTTRNIHVRGIGIDMSDAAATAYGMLVEGTYWHHFEDIHIDGCQAIGISIRGGTAGNYWGVWDRVHVNASDSVGATSRAGTGFFVDRNDADTQWVNQQTFNDCDANFLNVGWDIVEPGAGFRWNNCRSEAGNTSTGVGVRVTEPFEITYLDHVWSEGEINNYATGVSGRVMCQNALNLSPTARTNGASEQYFDGRASNDQNRRMVTYSNASYADVVQESSGTYGNPIAGFVCQNTTVASAATETVLALPADGSGNVHSGMLSLTAQGTTTVWGNSRDLYHLSTYYNTNGTLTLLNRDTETAITGLAVTLTHTDGVWSVRVTHTFGEDVRVRAHFNGLIPGV